MARQSPAPCTALSKGEGEGKQGKLTWVRAHRGDEQSRELIRYCSGKARATARAPPQGARSRSPPTVRFAPGLRITRGCGSARGHGPLCHSRL
ncbi:hypothetical protein NDU88_006008 [Pleurodeles waltl]|uniref:Uncharacterized protein n=1 Tax=Pleurodeles waltl TaxID=8319 RepID=A0AAV7TCQ0_PLEWA|nr:hypothetical protein NDU88_006008 [Pleurodeles waltl]